MQPPIIMTNFHSVAMPKGKERDDSSPTANKRSSLFPILSSLPRRIVSKGNSKRLIHSIKVGFSLVLASQLCLLQPLYVRVGENAIGAIMTVVVIFELTAGATLSKGLNRGVGTILGGGMGCVAALLAGKIGGISRIIFIGISVFISGGVASYMRLVPSIKKRFDYGVLIFILTFNLVAISGSRGTEIVKTAIERLSTIGMGFAVGVSTSLFIFPIWAGDELHHSLVSKFDALALSIKVCLKDYFKVLDTRGEAHASSNISGYKSVLQSKTADEMMANFAKWEPWHGKFGFFYPWDKYLRIGELLREFAACILSLEGCVQSHRQPPQFLKLAVQEPCEAVGALLSFTLRELGDDISNMRHCRPCEMTVAKLRLMRSELGTATLAFHSTTPEIGNDTIGDGLPILPIASFMFILMDMVEKAEALAKEVEELGDCAGFLPL